MDSSIYCNRLALNLVKNTFEIVSSFVSIRVSKYEDFIGTDVKISVSTHFSFKGLRWIKFQFRRVPGNTATRGLDRGKLNELDLLTRQYWKISNSRSFTNGGLEVRRNWVRKKSKIISNVQDDTGLDRLQIRLIHFILKRCLLVFPTFFLQWVWACRLQAVRL